LRSIGQTWGLAHEFVGSTWSLLGENARVFSLGWGMRDLGIVRASFIITPCPPSSSESSVDLVTLSNHFYRVRRLRLVELKTLQDGDELRRKGTFSA
jgi:hypothetical protein